MKKDNSEMEFFCVEYDNELKEAKQEIKRLNNIIKSLEKYVIDVQISEYGDTLEEAEQYLQELKGSE